MSLPPLPRKYQPSLGNKIIDAAYSVVDGSLQVAANSFERVHDSVWSTPKDASYEDEIVFHSAAARAIEGLRGQLKRGLPFSLNIQTVAALFDALVKSKFDGGLDDREYLLEIGLTFLSRLPSDSLTAKKLNDAAISLLWYDLAHPPPSVVGQWGDLARPTPQLDEQGNPKPSPIGHTHLPPSLIGHSYRFRSADGAGTSIWNPTMGAAKTPYARSVQARHPLPSNQLPSPELLFDTLLKREEVVEHPGGLSSFFFAFANLVIHSLFWTRDDPLTGPVNLVSSYLDLSPLYGSSDEEQKRVRLYDGTGGLYNDTFADMRLLGMPPSTTVLLVLFNRNHNYIVKKLLEINERGRWTNPPPAEDTARKQQDTELFETARLINCGWFMSTILGDYLSAILGTVREGSSWSLDPLSEFRAASHEVVERGTGNVCSIEFLALYHFHSSISALNEKWTEDLFAEMFPSGVSWDDVTPDMFKNAIRKFMMKYATTPANKWPIGNMSRDESSGKFDDAELARVMQEASDEPASAFKARGTPHVMRVVELMAIEQGRGWGACSLNEFRKFLGLKPYSTFEEWNPRAVIADAARRLYHHPDNIELYVGLQAEAAKEPVAGAGLCPGFTMSRAILADAVALVRGDRFYTNDFTSFNLTAWGFHDCARNENNSANGGMVGRLLLRTLPNHYDDKSAYTNFPFMVPSKMQKYLTDVGIVDRYTFDQPKALRPLREKALTKDSQVVLALADPRLVSTIPKNAEAVLPGPGYLASYNDSKAHTRDNDLIRKAFVDDTSLRRHAEYFERKAKELIDAHSYTLVDDRKKNVNVVRDVINLIPVHFLSEFILGLPLKTEENPRGSMLDYELHIKFREIYDYIFRDVNLDTKVADTPKIKEYLEEFKTAVAHHVAGVAAERIPVIGWVESTYHWLTGHPQATHEWLRKLLAAGPGKSKEFSNDAVALAILVAVQLSQALTHVVDTFLPPSGSEKPALYNEIVGLCTSPTSLESTTQLREKIAFALRTRPAVPGIYGTLRTDIPSPEDSKNPLITKGNRVYLSFTDAGSDPFAKDPTALFDYGLVELLGTEWLLTVILPVVKTLFRLRHLKRTPGNSGKLLSFVEDVHGSKVTMYLDSKQQPTWWSSDLTVTFSG